MPKKFTIKEVAEAFGVSVETLRAMPIKSRDFQQSDRVMKAMLRLYFAKLGSKGGKKSKRVLTPEQARAMVRAREKRKKKQ